MAKTITILGFTIRKGPRDLSLQTYNIPVNAPAAVTTVINFPTQFHAYAVSVAFQNLDAANQATIIINNDRINQIPLINGSPININTQWIVQVEIIAGAGGATTVLSECVPVEDVQ